MKLVKFSGFGFGSDVKITEEIMTKGSHLPNRIENKKSHYGIIVLLLICLISLYLIYTANMEFGCNGDGTFECLILLPLWWSCLFSTLLILPFYAFFYRFRKKRKDPWEI